MKHTTTHTYARVRSAIAQAVVMCVVVTMMPWSLGIVPGAEAASSFRPTIFVSTEAFLAIDDDDTTANVVLRFGDTLAKTLTFNRVQDRFEFNDDVYTSGTFTASGTLVTESGAVIDGGTFVVQAGNDRVGIRTFTPDTALDVVGAISGSFIYATQSFSGAGLSDCDTAGTSKLLWDAATGRFSCGTDTDTNTTYTAGQNLNLNGTSFRLNTTITGSLVNFQTVSGATVKAKHALASSGTLTWEGIGSGGKLFVKDFVSVGSRASGSLLTVGRVGSGTRLATMSNATLFSTDQMALGQLEGGAVFGRVGLKENQWGLSNYGNTWAAKESSRSWTGIAMSSDGKIQSAVADNEQIYVSINYGNTWAAKGSVKEWDDIAMSSDGKVQTATEYDNLHVSTDYGNTWTAKESARDWRDISMSSDGRIQAATGFNEPIYISTDYGNTWTAKGSAKEWQDIAMSSDGKVQTAVVYGFIHISSDYGNTWTAKESSRSWTGIAMSSDGKIQTATVPGDQLYVSTDYGNTWTAKESSRTWIGVAMSSDGKIQTATVSSGQMYVSTDYGNTWTAKESSRIWINIAMSSDGKIMTAVDNPGQIYVSHANSFQYGSVAIGTGSVKGNTKLMVQGILSGVTLYATKSFSGAGLSDCDTAGTSKLLWDATTGRFSCGTDTDTNTTYTAGQGLSLNGAVFSLSQSISGTLLEFQTVSGAVVYAERQLSTSGSTTLGEDAGDNVVFNADVNSNILPNTNNAFDVGSSSARWANLWANSANLSASLSVATTTSLNGNVGIGPANTTTKAVLNVSGVMSGITVYATKSFSGAGLSDCDTAGTSKLLWDTTTGRFSCGTDTDTNTTYTAGQGLGLNGTSFSLNAFHSGTTIWALNALRSSGALTWEGKGSGASLHVKNFLSVGASHSGSLLTIGRIGSGATIATASNATLFSTDQMALGQLEGGAVFGRVRLTENQWGLSNYGNTWTAKESSRNWDSIAMSSDGKMQTAVVDGGNIYISSNYGNTWTAKESNRSWFAVAMSSDGKMQTAVVNSGQIYTSSDYGNTWTAKGTNEVWASIAMSSDGKFQTAGENGGNIYISSDYGNTWTAKESTRGWVSIAMSSDGKLQTAVDNAPGYIYLSSDYGNTWTAKESSRSWYAIAMSSDGKVQSAAVYGGQIYISTDYGNTWTAKESARDWVSIAMSSDGKVQSAVDNTTGNIYISSNYGNTWTAKESARDWVSIAMSSDGKVQSAVVFSGQIYVSHADSFQYGSVAIGTGSVKGNTKLMVQGILSGVTLYATKSFSGAGLSDCDNGTTSKLLWDATTGRFSCGTDTDTNTTYTAGQGLSLNGTSFSLSQSISGTLLEFQTVSGALVYAERQLSTSGSTTLGEDAGDNVVFNAEVNSHVNPNVTTTYDLGSSSNRWREGFFQNLDVDGNVIATYVGASTSISTEGYFEAFGNLQLNSDLGNSDVSISFGNDDRTREFKFDNTLQDFTLGDTLSVSGSLLATGTISGSKIYGLGLSDCDTGATSKLLWDATTGRFSCGTDQTGGSGGNWSNTGSLQLYFDNRYVNTSGDTMTGSLVIQNGTVHAATLTALLNIRGTMSGRLLNISGSGSTPLLTTTSTNPTVRIGGSGSLVIEARSTDPGSAPANTASLFAQKVGGRTMLHQGSGSTFAASPLQNALFGNLIMSLSTGGGTTVNGYGTTVTNDTTVSHPASGETFGYMTNFATAATANDEAGTSSTTASHFRGSTAGANGFFYYARVGVVDTTSITVFSGMADQTIATMVGADNPAGNHVGFQFSTGRGDTNWMFTTKDNSTQNVNSTGLAFTANKVYDLMFMCTKQCASITWEIRNVTDGTSAKGTTSSNLPAAGTALRIVLGVEAETTTTKNIRMQQIYVEADR